MGTATLAPLLKEGVMIMTPSSRGCPRPHSILGSSLPKYFLFLRSMDCYSSFCGPIPTVHAPVQTLICISVFLLNCDLCHHALVGILIFKKSKFITWIIAKSHFSKEHDNHLSHYYSGYFYHSRFAIRTWNFTFLRYIFTRPIHTEWLVPTLVWKSEFH